MLNKDVVDASFGGKAAKAGINNSFRTRSKDTH
jgi:hypothetical protein